jgi:16S rRNA (adenine1518-N6/adenine1519-N6)-dimethyltransferase
VPRPKRSLGQNFLVDPNLQRKIAQAVDPQPDDTIVEIGPGTGALTRHLAGRVRELIAIEKDDELAASLETAFRDVTGVRIVQADALLTDLQEVAGSIPNLKIVGNIPYNITTPLIFHLLGVRPAPACIVLMIQREVADRILAQPGEKAYGALSIGVRLAGNVERLFHVNRRAFRPAPDVDSTVIRIAPHRPPLLPPDEEESVRTLTRVAFGWRRKQMQNILRNAPEYALSAEAADAALAGIGKPAEARPETLSPDDFVQLARALRPATEPQRARAANDTARQREADMRRLVGLLSHELRSPVAAIMGYQELLADGIVGTVDSRGREALGRIGGAARQLRSLIDAIELLLGETGATIAVTETVDVTATLQAVVAGAADEAEMRGTQLITALPELLPVSTDPDLLGRAFLHALGAALKVASGLPLTITARADADQIRIAVAGAPLAQLAATLDAELPTTGVTLRLAMARRTLRTLGGDLSIGVGADPDRIELVVPRG